VSGASLVQDIQLILDGFPPFNGFALSYIIGQVQSLLPEFDSLNLSSVLIRQCVLWLFTASCSF
jgi:hypothetical protein